MNGNRTTLMIALCKILQTMLLKKSLEDFGNNIFFTAKTSAIFLFSAQLGLSDCYWLKQIGLLQLITSTVSFTRAK